jgi:hypothetical protein
MASQHPNDDPFYPTAPWHPRQPTQNQSNPFPTTRAPGFDVDLYGQAGSTSKPHYHHMFAVPGSGAGEINPAIVRSSAYDQQLQGRSPRPFVASRSPFQLESYDTAALSYYTRSREDELSSSATLDSSQRGASTEEFSSSPSSPSLKLESDSGPTGTSLPDTIPDAMPTDSPRTRPKKKTTRKKPFIELALGQPPTSQGTTRERVFIACLPWYVLNHVPLSFAHQGHASRQRKIRCDGGLPVCYSCNQRKHHADECSYDPSPKRRGPDKVPGTRRRTPRNADSVVGDLPPARRRRRKSDDCMNTTAPSQSSPDTDNRNITPMDMVVSTHSPTSAPSSVDGFVYSPEDASRRSGSSHHGLSRQYGSTAFDRHLIPVNDVSLSFQSSRSIG